MELHGEDGKIDLGEVLVMLKKLSALMMLEAIPNEDGRKMALANSLGIVCATLDLGGDNVIELMKALNPLSETIAAEIKKKNPRLKGLSAVLPSEIIDEKGKFSVDKVEDVVIDRLTDNIDLSIVLKDTGAYTKN